jgi:hypothetical protein
MGPFLLYEKIADLWAITVRDDDIISVRYHIQYLLTCDTDVFQLFFCNSPLMSFQDCIPTQCYNNVFTGL